MRHELETKTIVLFGLFLQNKSIRGINDGRTLGAFSCVDNGLLSVCSAMVFTQLLCPETGQMFLWKPTNGRYISKPFVQSMGLKRSGVKLFGKDHTGDDRMTFLLTSYKYNSATIAAARLILTKSSQFDLCRP